MAGWRRLAGCMLAVATMAISGCYDSGETFDGAGVSVLCETILEPDPSTERGLPSVPVQGQTDLGTDSFGISSPEHTDEFGWYQYPGAKTSVTWTVTGILTLSFTRVQCSKNPGWSLKAVPSFFLYACSEEACTDDASIVRVVCGADIPRLFTTRTNGREDPFC